MLRDDYSLRFFASKVPPGRRSLIIVFAILFIAIILGQAFYFVFANSALPIVMGMPFGMFAVVALVVLEYVVLLVMERVLFKDEPEDK